jgi:hypothetical protein
MTNNNRLSLNELIDLLNEFDFQNFSMASFCRRHNVCNKTVKKYLEKYNIPYNSKERTIEYDRNPTNGQFILNSIDKKHETKYNKNEFKINNSKEIKNNYAKLPYESQKEYSNRMEKLIKP